MKLYTKGLHAYKASICLWNTVEGGRLILYEDYNGHLCSIKLRTHSKTQFRLNRLLVGHSLMSLGFLIYWLKPRGYYFSWEIKCSDPANTRRWPNAGLLLAQRRRRWVNISPALSQSLVFTGNKHRKKRWCNMCWTRQSVIPLINNQPIILPCYMRVISTIMINKISKLDTLNQSWFSAGPASQTVAQHLITSDSMSRVCWDIPAGKTMLNQRCFHVSQAECWHSLENHTVVYI